MGREFVSEVILMRLCSRGEDAISTRSGLVAALSSGAHRPLFPSFLVLGVGICALAGVALARVVFLVFLKFYSSSWYVSTRAVWLERVEPFGRASSSVSS